MKKYIKKFAIILILIATIILTHRIPAFAVEKEKNTSTSSTSSSANLSNLGISPNDFTGFKENTTSYNVTVPNNVSKVNVYATAKDKSATVTGTGNVELKEGANTAKVEVTAKDGTTKTYTINIKRQKNGETSTSSVTEVDEELGLTKLEIKGFELEPSFNKDVHQYTANIKGNMKSVDIETEVTKEDATVEVKGNTNLINGENIVTVLVTDEDGKNVSTYQIYVNKNLVKPSEIENLYKDANFSNEIKKWITIILVIIIIVCLFILKRIIRLKKEEKEDIEDDEDYYYTKRDRTTNQETIKSIQKIRENFDNINKQIQNEKEKAEKQKKGAKHGKHSK